MLRPYFILPALLFFGLSAQQPPATPAAPQQPPATPTAPAAPQQPPATPTAPTAPAAPGIPPAAAQMVNPVKPTAESIAAGKKVYAYDCAMCHGDNGNGKGDLVADMKLSLKDYTDPAALKGLSDGELFYIIKNGEGQMTGEGNRAKPEEIWNMVNLLRSFSKK